MSLTHLQRLEAEAIHIFREVAATFSNPVMLYSIGKDSSVMLHLAMKAFYPAKPPFPFLHVDTGWKFREMTAFRDKMAAELGIDLVWFLVMMAVNLNIAFISPPVGFSLFYLQSVKPPEVKTIDIHRGALPFCGLQLVALVLVMLIPGTVTWLA